MAKKTEKGPSKKDFTALLLRWNRDKNSRQMPWKGEKNPYRIWLSEIILQQTRVEQGLGYYQRFIDQFPTVQQLAAAPDSQVFKLWEGLGYYSRCRNLLASARFIAGELNGKFPDSYDTIKALKGIGPYTAAAISSFAFNLPHAVVDGNVFRVLARVFGIATPTDSTAGKKLFTELANDLLDKKEPGVYNQAIMDFGAVVCKPAAPLCRDCVFNKSCYAFLHDKVSELPIKEKKTRIRSRWFYYFVMSYQDKIAIRQRTTKDIWQQLYEFPLIETPGVTTQAELLKTAADEALLPDNAGNVTGISNVYKQQLSHQLITGRFIEVKLTKKPSLTGVEWVRKEELNKYAFPRYINQYLVDWLTGGA